MTPNASRCAIWPEFEAKRLRPPIIRGDHLESDRAGGAYCISLEAGIAIGGISDPKKALLTTWLINQRLQGVSEPEVTQEVLAHIETARPLSVHERANRLLRFFSMRSEVIGSSVTIERDTGGAYAWSESTDAREIDYLIGYLQEMGWFRVNHSAGIVRSVVTVDGYAHIAESVAASASVQGFIAMWFHESTNDALHRGIEPGIRDAGYRPFRIDQKPDLVKIDDEIMAEIRRSRFLVADFTQHEREARGGVYYEAGFAEGLGIPVIYTCHKDCVETLHFDTRQYAHIVWETPEELGSHLTNRIRARIGQGPI